MDIRDGEWTLFEHDAKMGRTTWVRMVIDEKGNIGSQFRTDYDVTSSVDLNAEQRNISSSNWAGDYHHVASIPLALVHQGYFSEAAKEQDEKAMSKWLNDSDNRAWRTKEGRL
jgi:hypothetical protein